MPESDGSVPVGGKSDRHPFMKIFVNRAGNLLVKWTQNGAVWFFLANALPSFIAIALGPFTLRKVGLEEYAVLGLATYFLNLVAGYSDFASYTHLLAVFSKKSQERFIDLANAFALKGCLLTLFFCLLMLVAHSHPRKDDLYPLLAISMLGILLPSTNMEWYFTARKRYFQFFMARTALMSCQILLIMAWFFSKWKSPLFIPSITVISGGVGSILLLSFLGKRHILDWTSSLRLVSFRGMRSLIFRLFPMAAALLILPYFLVYALPWYSLVCPDKKLVGAFSIGYRLIVGISSLIVPLVLYLIPLNATSSQIISFRKTLGWSLSAVVFFWMIGLPVLWFYFHVSKIDGPLFFYSLRTFSILMLGLFFVCLRTPYVGRWFIHGRYRDYFLILLISCSPVLLLSWIGGKRIPPNMVAWLACLPDFLATSGFIGYNRIRSRFKLFFNERLA